MTTTPETVEPGILPSSSPPDTTPAILCVDDDPHILDGFRRQLRKAFRLYTAVGAAQGMEAVSSSGPFAVVVSDFQMPGVNGIEFLAKVRALSPESVRIMLTGNADFSTAMAAVNQGNIFRFLIKPCPAAVLEKVLAAGVEQHRLQIAERQLTQETLLGCVQVLIEILSIVQPDSFSRASRVRRYVRHIVVSLGWHDTWQMEAAAMLSQIGWITLPPDLLIKAALNQRLSEAELPVFLKHASTAAKILEKIPRFGTVARMIEKQHVALKDLLDKNLHQRDLLDEEHRDLAGAQILKAASDFDNWRQSGMPHAEAISRMRSARDVYLPEIVEAMTAIQSSEAQDEIRLVSLSRLIPGMILEDELRAKHGLLILGKGQEIPATFVQRLANFDYGFEPDHMCRVRLPRSS